MRVVDEVPRRATGGGRPTKYPYDDLVELVTNQNKIVELDATDYELDGTDSRKVNGMATTIRQWALRRGHNWIVSMRKPYVYVQPGGDL